MTRSEFMTEALSFIPGKIVVVSGANLEDLFDLLLETRDYIIETTENDAIVVDSRALTQYPSDDAERAVLFEQVVVSSPDSVILVPNEFDIDDPNENKTQRTLTIDVVMDLMDKKKLERIPQSGSRLYVFVRNLFPFMSRIYYFENNNSIKFVKNQDSER